MSFPLYHRNGNYYMIVDRGMTFSYVIDFQNFNSRLIGNEELSSFEELEFSAENLEKVLKGVSKNGLFDLTNFDDFKYTPVIHSSLGSYYVNDWRDIMNVIRDCK